MARTMTARQSAAQGQMTMENGTPLPPQPIGRQKLTPRYGDVALPAINVPIVVVEAAPADDGLPPSRATYHDERAASEPFGYWLLKQSGRGGLIGLLAAGAAADRGFSKAITPDELRARLVAQSADGDMHAALDDAEIDWLAL